MSDGLVTAIVITNLILGLATLGIVIACVVGRCSSMMCNKKEPVTEEIPAQKSIG